MKTLDMQPSRRQFIQKLGLGAAWLGLATNTCSWYSPIAQLPYPFAKMLRHCCYIGMKTLLACRPMPYQRQNTAIERCGNRYPDAAVDEFKVKLADHHNVKPEQLIFGNGSTEVLQAIATYAAQNNATMVEPSPTFGDLKGYCKAENLNVIQVPVGHNFEMNIAGHEKTGPSTNWFSVN